MRSISLRGKAYPLEALRDAKKLFTIDRLAAAIADSTTNRA
jgi:hypothetical protein